MTQNPIYGDSKRHPVNGAARRIFSGGVRYESKKIIAQAHWSNPPNMCQIPPNTPDLVGQQFGRFTVIGWYADGKKTWVVRCSCGNYETRKSKAIRNPNNSNDACQNCRHLMHLQGKQEWRVRNKKKAGAT